MEEIKMMKKRLYFLLLSSGLLVAWQLAGSWSSTVRLLISTPQLVIAYFVENVRDLLLAFGTTLIESLTGFLIAIFFSFSAMILCFYKPKLMEFILPVLVTSQVVPLIVLAPFFIILLGIGLASKIAMAALMCFFPIFINFAQGYKAISSNIEELMYIYNAPLRFRIIAVYFPLSLSSIMAGLKVSVSLAVIGSIVAEFTGAVNGLGKNLFVSALRLEPELMMSSLILSTFLGLVFFQFIVFMEKKLINWT
jgi:NitT/TauT family transport system permease protein